MDNESDERPRRNRDRDRDPDREYDRGPSRGSSNRTTWIILGAAGCGLVLVCSGALALLVVWGFKSFTTDFPAAQAAADQFLDKLQADKVNDAYALTSTKFHAEQSREQFEGFVKRFETLTRHTSRTQNGFRLFQGPDGKRASIQMTLNAPNNAMTCTLVLTEEAGTWKVEMITVP